MRVLVTGASGFIGGVVCRRLLEDGHEVVSLVRREAAAPAGTAVVVGDLGDAPALRAAVATAAPEVVIHLAAEIASQRDGGKVEAVNIGGTERLLAACRELAAAPRFVFCSTVVTGEADGALLTEESELPVRTPYGRAKQAGERMVAESGLPYVIVRPSHVYGPGGWYADELVTRLRQPGRFAVIGSGANLWDVVHVDDAASSLLLAAFSEDAMASGAVYHVVDDEPISYYDFMALTAQRLGVGAPRRIPARLARAVAGNNAVDAVVRSARSSNARVKRELGWTLRYPTAREGVAAAVDALSRG